MTRASTTPSMPRTAASSLSASARALVRFFAVTRTLIGVDLPSFMAERIIPPASNANSVFARSNGSTPSGHPFSADFRP